VNSIHTGLGLPSELFLLGFWNNILYALLISPMLATCSTNLIFLDLFTIISGKGYKLWRPTYAITSRLRLFLHLREAFEKFVDSPYYSESELCGGVVTVSFSKYLLWHPISKLFSSLKVRDQVLRRYKNR